MNDNASDDPPKTPKTTGQLPTAKPENALPTAKAGEAANPLSDWLDDEETPAEPPSVNLANVDADLDSQPTKRKGLKMDSERIKGSAKGIGVLIVIGVIIFSMCGGWGWLFGSKSAGTPVASSPTANQPESDSPIGKAGGSTSCADGTVYTINSDAHKLIWLIHGKAVVVNFDDFDGDNDLQWFGTDASGGVYISGKTHLWYVRSGIAKPVTTAPASDIGLEEHKVTRQTVLWSAIRRFGNNVHDSAYEEGKEDGLEQAHEPAPGGGGE